MANRHEMSEHEWIKSKNPSSLLAFLGKRISERKRRLFACACCRKVQERFTDERSWNAVLAAERYADGLATATELKGAAEAAKQVYEDAGSGVWEGAARAAVRCVVTDPKELWQLDLVWGDAAIEFTQETGTLDYSGYPDEWFDMWSQPDADWEELYREFAISCGNEFTVLLREIVGNPFHPIKFDPQWRTSDVLLLARGIYEECAFDRMPILADAIQDAGCNNYDVLSHCRSTSKPHVRGCWVVDLVLGKQ